MTRTDRQLAELDTTRRRDGESISDHVLRLHVHELCKGFTNAELAAEVGCSAELVANVREAFQRSKRVTEILSYARVVHRSVGYKGPASKLVMEALREYERVHRRVTEAAE
jgi:hypothetical protein